MLLSTSSNCQNLKYKPYFKFNFNVGARVNKPNTFFNSNYGGTLDCEVKYIKSNNFSLGLQLEQSFLQNENSYRDLGKLSGIIGNNFSAYSTYDYTLSSSLNPFKPYFGGGLGINNLKQWESIGYENHNFLNEVKLGVLFRTGFEYKFFNLGVVYNLIGKTIYQNRNIENSYFTIKLGTNIKLGTKSDSHYKSYSNNQSSAINLIIYRNPTLLSSFIQIPIFVNDSLLKIKNGDIINLSIKKFGKSEIVLLHDSKREVLEIDIRPGLTYYVKCNIKSGFFNNKYYLNSVDSTIAFQDLLKIKK